TPTPHRADPTEDLNTRRHRDEHGQEHEDHSYLQTDTTGEHVVSPNKESKDSDGHHRPHHDVVTKDRLAREGRKNLADHSESRQNHDVHCGVRVEPKKVLIEDGVTTTFGG